VNQVNVTGTGRPVGFAPSSLAVISSASGFPTDPVKAFDELGRASAGGAADYAGINTNRVRFMALLFCALCATMAGLINIAYFRSFNPTAGQFRELDGIAAVIIGGASIFGGFGTVIGALAGAAVITLLRALLQLNVQGYTMPQQWVNSLIGAILIIAVLADIWVRQHAIISRLWDRIRPRRREAKNG